MRREDQAARRVMKRRQNAARARPADLEEIFWICVDNQQFGHIGDLLSGVKIARPERLQDWTRTVEDRSPR